MKTILDYIYKFAFKNAFAVFLVYYLFKILLTVASLHDSCVVLLTLIVKFFFDTSNASAKKDETISNALTAAQQTPATPIAPITPAP